jgi:hypothetical protein
MEDKNAFRLSRLKDFYERANSYEFYGVQRMDLLIISISGVGIYITLEILRFFYTENIHQDLCWLKIGGVLFALAIFTNFISQLTGQKANSYDAKWSDLEIKKITESKDYDEYEQKKSSDGEKKFSNYTLGLNIASTVLMLLGVVILMIFNIVIL